MRINALLVLSLVVFPRLCHASDPLLSLEHVTASDTDESSKCKSFQLFLSHVNALNEESARLEKIGDPAWLEVKGYYKKHLGLDEAQFFDLLNAAAAFKEVELKKSQGSADIAEQRIQREGEVSLFLNKTMDIKKQLFDQIGLAASARVEECVKAEFKLKIQPLQGRTRNSEPGIIAFYKLTVSGSKITGYAKTELTPGIENFGYGQYSGSTGIRLFENDQLLYVPTETMDWYSSGILIGRFAKGEQKYTWDYKPFCAYKLNTTHSHVLTSKSAWQDNHLFFDTCGFSGARKDVVTQSLDGSFDFLWGDTSIGWWWKKDSNGHVNVGKAGIPYGLVLDVYANLPAKNQPIVISINPGAVHMRAGNNCPFKATVTGTSNTGVKWSATGGSIDSNGVYTAPSTVGTYRVRATSDADTTKFAEVSVTVNAPIVVLINPASVNLQAGQNCTFKASVTGTSNTGVEWSATGGSIDSNGVYIAPLNVGSYRVRAASIDDKSKFAEATVEVTAKTVATQGDKVPLYRYYNNRSGDHFYTTNWNELKEGAGNYKFEGVQAYVYAPQIIGTVPLYRYFNGRNGDHFYTTNWNELKEGAGSYRFEGIQAYVYDHQVSGTVPLYRYYNSRSGDHFYTTNWNELKDGGGSYKSEGIQCYVFSTKAL